MAVQLEHFAQARLDLRDQQVGGGHVEDLERPRKDGQRLGMRRLRRARLDEPPPQTSASAFIGQKQPDRSRAYDQDVGINVGTWHRLTLFSTYDSPLPHPIPFFTQADRELDFHASPLRI